MIINPKEPHYDDKDEDDSSYRKRPNVVTRFTKRGSRTDQGPIQNPVAYSSFLCGLLAGVSQAAVFNPYDRALYLSVKERRSFLSLVNWKSPYNGFLQSLGGRALSGGLYFPLEHMFLHVLAPNESGPLVNFFAGTAAGAANAIVLNPLSAIKYKTWGREINRGMWTEARRMFEKGGGLRPFFNGLKPTLYRDIVFGGCYTWLRLQIQVWFDLPAQQQWQANLVAAALATVVSGPFNYARNMQYATSSRKEALSTWSVLQELVVEVRKEPDRFQKVLLLGNRLRIGWGTARVGMGVAFGHFAYDTLDEKLRK